MYIGIFVYIHMNIYIYIHMISVRMDLACSWWPVWCVRLCDCVHIHLCMYNIHT